ncbi:unnamed protein product [Acanthocheilonema viteae]|uniref:Copine C-terminal domain-containing protein n=1 Tax=Acanthocheilonema viteae TaxID=6277 RepID=A0A498S5N3_ACAVI|nr:unnamed protein product [Acanthocheilonema viteae]
MNMTRIRQIIALRKAVKAGPLLPPISKRPSGKIALTVTKIHMFELKFLESFDVQHYSREKPFGDGSCCKKVSAKDILEIDLHISGLKTDLFSFDDVICLISVNENGLGSSWKRVATTEIIHKTDIISIPNAFSVEYTFKRDQHLKIEICDYSEKKVTIIGSTTFFVTEVVITAKNLSKPLISQSYAAFGFGARIPPYFRKSQQFCLNLETDPNCQGIDGLIDAFWKANAQVQPSTTAHFAHIIYHLSKLASNVRRHKNQLQCPYFVLAIVSKGKINDIRETVQATIFASKAPLSIIFIATEDDCTEMERLGLSGGRISYQNRRAERDMLQFVALTKFRSKLPDNDKFWELFTERALRHIPSQMISWFMKNGHIPQDFKHYGSLPKQGSSGISGHKLEHGQERINVIECFSDQSVEDLDEAEYASTSDYCKVEKNHSYTETENFSAISSTPFFISKNA